MCLELLLKLLLGLCTNIDSMCLELLLGLCTNIDSMCLELLLKLLLELLLELLLQLSSEPCIISTQLLLMLLLLLLVLLLLQLLLALGNSSKKGIVVHLGVGKKNSSRNEAFRAASTASMELVSSRCCCFHLGKGMQILCNKYTDTLY